MPCSHAPQTSAVCGYRTPPAISAGSRRASCAVAALLSPLRLIARPPLGHLGAARSGNQRQYTTNLGLPKSGTRLAFRTFPTEYFKSTSEHHHRGKPSMTTLKQLRQQAKANGIPYSGRLKAAVRLRLWPPWSSNRQDRRAMSHLRQRRGPRAVPSSGGRVGNKGDWRVQTTLSYERVCDAIATWEGY